MQKAKLANGTELRKKILKKVARLNMQKMAMDVSHFFLTKVVKKGSPYLKII